MKLSPKLLGGKYYFATLEVSKLPTLSSHLDYIISIFREEEGITIVFSEDVKGDVADISEKPLTGPFALITISVQTDLYAIGILAKITEALAKEKIAVNAFSAYFHDHIFVPYEKKDIALRILQKLA